MNRKERREAERTLEKARERARKVALPIYAQPDSPPRKFMREAAFIALGGDKDDKALRRATLEGDRMMDEAIRMFLARGGDRPACTRGCYYCCHGEVAVTIPELLTAVDAARAKMSADQLEALRARAKERAAQPYDETTKHRRACALLVDGACSIYEARPLHCRLAHSMDVEPCRKQFHEAAEHPTMPGRKDVFVVTMESYLGYREGLTRGGVDARFYDLCRALAIVLEDPSAIAKWRAGEPVFESACVQE